MERRHAWRSVAPNTNSTYISHLCSNASHAAAIRTGVIVISFTATAPERSCPRSDVVKLSRTRPIKHVQNTKQVMGGMCHAQSNDCNGRPSDLAGGASFAPAILQVAASVLRCSRNTITASLFGIESTGVYPVVEIRRMTVPFRLPFQQVRSQYKQLKQISATPIC